MFDIPTHFSEALRLQNDKLLGKLDRIIELLEELTEKTALVEKLTVLDGWLCQKCSSVNNGLDDICHVCRTPKAQ